MKIRLLIILSLPFLLYGQGIDNLWMMGYGNQFSPPVGGFDIDFITGAPVITSFNRQINFSSTSVVICDSTGHILFCSNGVYVANKTGDTIINGSGLSPSYYTLLIKY